MKFCRFRRAFGIFCFEHLVLAIPHAAQLPRMKEWRPVDVIDEVAEADDKCGAGVPPAAFLCFEITFPICLVSQDI